MRRKTFQTHSNLPPPSEIIYVNCIELKMGCGSSARDSSGEPPLVRHRRMYNMTFLEYKNKLEGEGIKRVPVWE
jgi:hypothetical protein